MILHLAFILLRKRRKDPDLFSSISYQLKFGNMKLIDALVDKLNMIDYSNGEGISEELFVDTVINKFYNI